MAPSGAMPQPSVTESSQQEAVAACLERIKPFNHFQAKRLAFEIRDVGFTPAGTLATLQQLARWIYDRAITDPERFAAPCAALCFSLTPILPSFKPPGAVTPAAKAKRIDFRQTLLNLCQREFEAACGPSQPSSNLHGSLQFLAYLYLHHLLTDRIMLSCLAVAASGPIDGDGAKDDEPQPGSINISTERLQCIAKALLVAGRQLHEGLAPQHRPRLEELYGMIRSVHDSDVNHTPELRASLGRLLELQTAGWPAAASTTAVTATLPREAPVPTAPRPPPAVKSGLTHIATPHLNGFGAATGPATPTASATPSARTSSSGCLPALGSQPGVPSGSGAGAPCLHGQLMRRMKRASGGGGMQARGSSQNLDGLWNLTPDTYADARAQLLLQMASSSSSNLEAAADELVECAIAASSSDAGVTLPAASSAGAVAGASEHNAASTAAATGASGDWLAQVQRQWDENFQASDIYVRLAADVLQHLNAQATASAGCGGTGATGASPGGQAHGGAEAGSAAAASASAGQAAEAGRTFRRHLLSATQSHFERCMAALLPPATAQPLSPVLSSPPVSSQGGSPSDASLPTTPSSHPSSNAAASTSAASTPQSVTTGSACTNGHTHQGQQQEKAWADTPAVAPDAASALPRCRGVCHLLVGLLRHAVLTPRIVLHCAAALVEGAAAGSVGCLECACILLAGAGQVARTFKMAEAAAFESQVKRLQALADMGTSEGGEGPVAEQRRRFVAWLREGLHAK